jgi:hypothetical protein
VRYEVDGSELVTLAADLIGAPDRLMAEVEPVVEKGALNVRRGAQELLRSAITGVYLPHYGRAITYEMERGNDWVQADIGPEVDKPQGGMGRGVEVGSSNTAPIPHMFPALDEEEPRFVAQALAAAGRSLAGG